MGILNAYVKLTSASTFTELSQRECIMYEVPIMSICESVRAIYLQLVTDAQ